MAEIISNRVNVTADKLTREDYAKWLVENKDKQNSDNPEDIDNFNAVAEAYKLSSADDPNSPFKKSFDFSAVETAKNFLPSLGSELKNMATAITQPVETVTALTNLLTGLVQKVLPGVQDKEKYANALIQHYSTKYGSKDEFLRYLQEQPAAVLGDAAMLLTGGGTSVRLAGLGGKTNIAALNAIDKVGQTISKTGAAIDPLNLTLNTGGLAATQGTKYLAPNFAPNLYESALKPSTALSIKERKSLVETALENDIPLNMKGVGKLEILIQSVGNKIDDLIAEATATGKKIPVDKIFEKLQLTREELKGPKINVFKNLDELDSFETTLRLDLKKQGYKELSVEDLQTLKRSAYENQNWNTKKQTGTKGGEEALSATGRATKELIEESVPEIQKYNREIGDLLELKPILERAVNRIGGRDMIGIGLPIKASAGAALGGGVGSQMGILSGLFDLPGPKNWLAREIRKKENQGLLQYGDNSPIASLSRNLLGDVGNQETGLLYGIQDLESYF